MEEVKIKTEYITLGQLLKFLGIITNGSEAKMFLANNKIIVENEEENRRGRKLYPNYVIIIKEKEYIIT